jgi:hypothetical protein
MAAAHATEPALGATWILPSKSIGIANNLLESMKYQDGSQLYQNCDVPSFKKDG